MSYRDPEANGDALVVVVGAVVAGFALLVVYWALSLG